MHIHLLGREMAIKKTIYLNQPQTQNMMKHVIAMTFVLLAATAGWSKNTIVIGADDKEIIARATVISNNGMILGVTDDNGHLPEISDKDYPIIIRSIGYKEQSVAEPSDTIWMATENYNLPEILVVSGERPITRVVSYVREYCTGATSTDTVQMFSEYMVQSFHITQDKVKGYKKGDRRIKPLSKRQYARYANANCDSVLIPGKDEEPFYMLSFAETISEVPASYKEPAKIRDGFPSDTIPGKYGPKYIVSKTKDRYMVCKDALADYEGHRYSPWVLKMIGASMDITQVSRILFFVPNERGKYSVLDFISGAYNSHIVAKGKWLKKIFKAKEEVDMDCYVELYPVSVTFHTVSEYKELKSDKSEMPFTVNDQIPPIPPSVTSIINRLSEIGKK